MRTNIHRTLALLALVTALSGCSLFQSVVGDPVTVQGTKLRPTEFTWSQATFDLSMDLANNTGIDIPVNGIDWVVNLGDAEVFRDSMTQGQTLTARETTTINTPVTLRYVDVANLVMSLARGEKTIPYSGEIGFTAAPFGREMRRSIPLEGEIPVPSAPNIHISDIEVGSISLNGISGSVTLDASGESDRLGSIADLICNLNLNGRSVASMNGVSGSQGSQVTIPWEISGFSAVSAAREMIDNHSMDFSLLGEMTFDAPWGPVSVPLDMSFSGEE